METIVYAALIGKQTYYCENGMLYEDGWFYSTIYDLQESTTLGEKAQTYYSSPAHTVHSFDFITKPFKYEDFERVLNDFMRTNRKRSSAILDIYTEQGQLLMQNVDDIICFRKDKEWKRKVMMCTVQKEICVNGTIPKIFSGLDSRQFFIPHISFIINLRHVIALEDLYTIKMTNGYEIPLSQKRKEGFKDKIHKFAVR